MSIIEKSIVVDCPVSTVYNQWTQFETFPQFMEGVEEVRQIDAKRVHWRADIAGVEREWDAEIRQQIPDRSIGWRSIDGPRVTGVVTFEPLAPTQTRVNLRMEYEPTGVLDRLGDFIGAIDRRIEGDLQRFKEFIETRGIETGQWRGEIRAGEVRSDGDKSSSGTSTDNAASRTASASQSGSVRARSKKRGTAMARADAMPAFPRIRSPFALMQQFSSEMDRLFESFFQRDIAPSRSMSAMWSPQVDVREQGDKLVVSADLPGLDKQDVKVEINEGVLTIRGERRDDRESDEEGFRRVERTYGSFFRAIPLPEGVNAEAAQARMQNGVLEIELPVQQGRSSGQQVEIR